MDDAPKNERYEVLSLEWVNALRRHLAEKAASMTLDADCVLSCEYTNPPPHLLRADGRGTVGYAILARNGAIEVLDGAHHDQADFTVTSSYDPVALMYRTSGPEYQKWILENGERLRAEGKIIYGGKNREGAGRLFGQLNMFEFYSRYTK